MTDPEPGAPVGPPPAFDVVPVEAAQALMDEVHAARRALERELEQARQQADEAEAGATMVPALGEAETEVFDDLRRMADDLRADAAAEAARVRDDARWRAAALVDDARRTSAAGPSPPSPPSPMSPTSNGSHGDAPTSPSLRLAPHADPETAD